MTQNPPIIETESDDNEEDKDSVSGTSRPYESPLISPFSMRRNDSKFKSFGKKKAVSSYALEEEKDSKSITLTQSKPQTDSNQKDNNDSVMNNAYKLFSDYALEPGVGVIGTRMSQAKRLASNKANSERV